jgi:hypothetical protein
MAPRPVEWDEETKANVAWLKRVKAPKEPFMLAPWMEIVNPERYFATLREEAGYGPQSPRSLTGAFQAELAMLREHSRRKRAGK